MLLQTNTGLTAFRPGLHRNRQQSENQSTEEPPEGTHVGLRSDPVHSSDTQTGETLYSPDPPVIIHIQSVPVIIGVCRLADCRCYFHTFGWKQISWHQEPRLLYETLTVDFLSGDSGLCPVSNQNQLLKTTFMKENILFMWTYSSFICEDMEGEIFFKRLKRQETIFICEMFV